MSEDRKYVQIKNENNHIEWYKRTIVRQRNKYVQIINIPELNESRMIGILRRFTRQKKLIICGIKKITDEMEEVKINAASDQNE